MRLITSRIFQTLARSHPQSHKGQNGRTLIIAGSNKYHGALLLTVQAASRIVDMVYVYSTEQNLRLIQKLRSEIATFIAIPKKTLWQTVELSDTIIIGPGLKEDAATVRMVKKLLTDYPHKKTLIDATALWHANPEWLHRNCVVTPHSREFENVFKVKATKENVHKMAERYGCIIVLTGPVDYIGDGKDMWENKTGNAGMTKGGTGDVLVGLIGALAATNNLLTSALAGTYINGLAGNRLRKKVGTFYNAEDLTRELGAIFKTRPA